MNKHYTLKAGISCLLMAVALLFSNSSFAQTIFSGALDSDYAKAGNWSAGIPSAINPGTIPGGATVNINSALNISFTLTSYGTINANAVVTVSGTLNNYTGSDFNIGSEGGLTNNGTIDQRGSLDITAGGQFTSTGNYSSTGSAVINNGGSTSLSGTFSNLGTINNSGTLAINGGAIGNNTAINNNGTFNLNGGILTNFNGANINNAVGKTLNHNTGATLDNQGTLTNNGTYVNGGILTSNGTIANNGLFDNNFGGNLTNNFRLNNYGTFNNNSQGHILNEFEINNGGTFNNYFFIDNGAQIYNLVSGLFVNAITGDINNQFGSTISNANIINNLGKIQSVGDIINHAIFTNNGSIYTNTGGGIVNSGNFINNSLLSNLEEIANSVIFTNNGQLQNNSGGVFTNGGDLYNAQPARISNDYVIINNQNLYNNGTIENGVRVYNNDYFENNGYLINIGDFINDVTGLFHNTGTSTTQGSNGGVLENSNGGIFSNRGILDNYNEIFNFECSSFINTGTINNYYWWTNHSLFFNYGTFNNLPYHQMNMEGGVEITGPHSSAICENVTVSINANGTALVTGASVATSFYDNCSTLTLTINGAASVTYTCADIGIKPVKLMIADRIGTTVMCSATITIVDNTAPVFQNCPTDVVVVGTGTTTPATWTAPTATDNCGPVNVTSTHTPGSSFPNGTTAVTYNAVDGRGNGAAPCTFNVIVVPPGDCGEVASIRKVSSTATNCGAGTAYAMWLNNEYYTAGSDLLFIQYTNGTAQLVGSVNKGTLKGYVEVLFSGKTTTAPAGSPKLELCVTSGSPAWTYYPSLDGTVTLDDCRKLTIKRYGPAPQMGLGGNLQDVNQQGASAWFSTDNGVTHGGDFNFRLGEAVQCQSGIYLEAECASYGSKWQLRTDANASNGKLLLPPAQYSYDYAPTNTADLVTFNVNVTVSGSYRIFARSAVPNSDGDSYWVRVNNGTWVKWNTVNAPSYAGFQWDQVGNWNGSCSNDLPVSFNLVAGANTIQFAWREPNACLDKLFLTLSGKKPTGLGGNATNCGSNNGGGGTPPPTTCNKSALFLVGDAWLCASDAAVKARLEGLGYTVTVKDDDQSATSDATGKGIILISSTVTSTAIGTKYRDVNVPIINWESYLYDDLKMTGLTAETHYGARDNITSIRITDANHPIAQGFTGDIALFNNCKTITWGVPGSAATKIGSIPNCPSNSMLFTYDTGASMVGMNAPARRVGFFLHNDNAQCLTANGWRIFDRTVQWASGCNLGINLESEHVDVLDLQAQRGDQMVSLYWKNNTGFKNETFTIEKSVDGMNWEVLAVQDAFLNEDQSTNMFEDVDLAPVIGDNHYRVVVTYLDGTTQASGIQVITINDIEDFGIYPNPAGSATNLNLETLVGEKNVVVKIFDWTGRQVQQVSIEEVYDPAYTLDLQQLHTGRYSVQVSANGKRPVAKKLIISK